ncbi:MAG: triple tyrosine motif-containing protein [Clostridiaceae bacterium]
MNEIKISANVEKYENQQYTIKIGVEESPYENLLYKYIIGFTGKWETIKNFTSEKIVKHSVKDQGTYIIMVQSKKENSTKSFDYVSRYEFYIGDMNKSLIKNIVYQDKKYNVGDKLKIEVETSDDDILLRYWVNENNNWMLIKDYSNSKILNWNIRIPKEQELLIEAKEVNSTKNFEDSKKIKISVEDLENIEITSFKCLTPELLKEKELIFKVSSNLDEKRTILYKFTKIKEDGEIQLIQDYSTKKMASFVENDQGKYKLLCYAKDMYSLSDYDSRAVINYSVLPYPYIKILSFTSDYSSPSPCGRVINLKTIVTGGINLLYKFIINGPDTKESPYGKVSNYEWTPEKSGEYDLTLYVKDSSYQGEYESKTSMKYVIDENKMESAEMESVEISKEDEIVIGECVNVKAYGKGSSNIRYAFIVRKNNQEIGKIPYGTCSFADFTPTESGLYTIDVLAKDKYSEKEQDSHIEKFINVKEYREAYIDHVLIPVKDRYLIGESLKFNIVVKNTKDVLIKYILRINKHKVEEIDYKETKVFDFVPKIKGEYIIEFYAKNKKSDKNFDSKKAIKINVTEALPITNTKLYCDKIIIKKGDSITLNAGCDGGKNVLYEFYTMEDEEWNMAQKYSKLNYFSLVTYREGKYQILVLTKSEGNNASYEDYDILEIEIS